jgi:DNA polymerase-4
MGRSADLPRTSGEIDGDDAGCTILHVDMDAFFASVEIRARPELRGLPVVVGGTEGRGVVAAASYEARRYGVRSAMSMGRALQLCPRAVVIAPTRGAYTEASRAIMAIFAEFTPLIEPLSLDEAFLDVSGSVGLFGRPADIARQIRARVEREQHLTCSVGVAPVKSVAKLASGSCKPNGLRVVSKAGLFDFLHPLPVTALWGVGERTAEPLRRLGIRTVGELAEMPLDTLRRAVGTAVAEHLYSLAHGRDDRQVTARAPEKSISTDRTLLHDLLTEDEVVRELLRGSMEVAERLRRAERVARTIGIKIRFADFTTITRVRTLAEPTDSSESVYEAARELYRLLDLDRPRIRLVGVKAENLRPASEAVQLALDLTTPPVSGPIEITIAPDRRSAPERNPAPGRRSVPEPADRGSTDRVIDALTARFGSAAVQRASLLRPAAAADRVTRRVGRADDENRRTDNKSSQRPGNPGA